MSSWDDTSDYDNKGRTPIHSQTFGRGGNRRNDNRNEGNKRNSNSGNNEEKTITIESSNVGRMVGRGGATIRQLESDSHCRIFINKQEPKGDQTSVRIQGSSQDDVDKACEMIENLMSNSSSDSRGSNRNRDDGFSDSRGSNRNRDDGFSDRGSNRNRDNGFSDRGPNRNRDDGFSDRGSNRNRDDGFPDRGYNRNRDDGFSDRGSNRNRDDHRRNDRFSRDDFNSRDQGSFKSNKNFGDNDDSSKSDYYQSNYYESSSYNNSTTDNDAPEPEFKVIDWTEVYAKSDALEAERLAKMPKIVKKTYQEDPAVARMSSQQVETFRQQNMNISVSRVFAETEETKLPIPNPVMTFEQAFGPYPEIMKTIQDQNFKLPSPIQCQAWPVVMSGEDMIGIAQTGTGKTLAFLLPAFLHIEAQPVPRDQRVGPTVLILSPTRELALQIEKEINKYSYRGIKCVCVYGGGSRKDQITWIRRDNPEIIVATPGRLDDLVMATEVKLDSTTYIVLDEADKMLEMGFECQIRKILINIRRDRQSIMTSATWPSGVRRLASQYSVNPIQVVVGSLDLAAVHSVTQKIIMVDEDDKRSMLDEFLSNMEPDDKVIVFCGKKSVTDDISSDLVLQGVKCQSLHGNREQCDREQALSDLKTGEVRILIATDVAARGIDIPDITHIFNYDFPRNIEEYVHRIGRTGRAGRTGESISLFTRRDWANAKDLIKILEEANQGVPEELLKMSDRFDERKERDAADRRGGRGGGFGGRRGGGGFRDREGGRDGGGFRSDGGGRRGGGGFRGGRERY